MTNFDQMWAEMAMDTPLTEGMDAILPLKKLKEFIEKAYDAGYKEGRIDGETSFRDVPRSLAEWRDSGRWKAF